MSTAESAVVAKKVKKPNVMRPRRPLFARFVEVGRVIRILRGADTNKLAVIIEIIDQNRVLIHGPTTGVCRKPIRLAYVDVTPFRVKTKRAARKTRLIEDIKKHDFMVGWNKTLLAKRLKAAKLRSKLSDFDNYKARNIRRARRTQVIEGFRRARNIVRKARAVAINKHLKYVAEKRLKKRGDKPVAPQKDAKPKVAGKPKAADKPKAAGKPKVVDKPKK